MIWGGAEDEMGNRWRGNPSLPGEGVEGQRYIPASGLSRRPPRNRRPELKHRRVYRDVILPKAVKACQYPVENFPGP
jgi:hypothetical protein